MLADVAQARSAEHSVDDGVCQHVGVRMPVQPEAVVNVHATDDQVAAVTKRVHVVARADPQVAAASCSLISASTTSKSSGVVSLKLAGSPSTTVTKCPV